MNFTKSEIPKTEQPNLAQKYETVANRDRLTVPAGVSAAKAHPGAAPARLPGPARARGLKSGLASPLLLMVSYYYEPYATTFLLLEIISSTLPFIP